MISASRINDRINQLSKIGKTEEDGVTRLTYTKELLSAQSLVNDWMMEAGMKVHTDPAGNVIGKKNGSSLNTKPIVIGSHIDSVSNGGRFDGVIGVICGIEVVQHIYESNLEHKYPIEVISFTEEEASRFGSAFFGSRALIGDIKDLDLKQQDKNGETRREAMEELGFDPDMLINNSQEYRKKGEQELYLELHIEQGPVLEQEKVPVGIVTGIPGIIMSRVNIKGRENHIGGTPMDMRQDALLGASEIALAVEKACLGSGPPAVGAVGEMRVSPGETNVIPGHVEMSIDIRNTDINKLESMYEYIQGESQKIEKERSLAIQFTETKTTPAPCNEKIIELMGKQGKKLDIETFTMASGGGHDAQIMAEISDIGMIFIRSTGGSHNPEEFAHIDDITLGTELLFETLINYD